MNMNIYSIFDKGIEAYLRPFTMQAHGQAIRSFLDEVNNDSSPISKHPEDYTLFFIGTWNESNAEIVTQEPMRLARGHEMRESS